jgi:DNA repair exonuclease SbcCD ATPase subunit
MLKHSIDTLNELVARKKSLEAVLEMERASLKESSRNLSAIVKGQKILQEVARDVQQHAHKQIASVVSKSLKAVFDEPYEFRINFEKKRGKTEAQLEFVRDNQGTDPLTAAGGGVVDVAAFALRIACLVLSRPVLRRVVVLDEPFRFVSEEYRQRISDLLIQLSEDLKIQFVIVTHMKELKVGKIYRL